MTPPPKQRKHSKVPNLMLENLPPRRLHYFSEDSQRSNFDISFEQKRAHENASLAKKYNLSSYVDRMRQAKIKGEPIISRSIDKNIKKLGKIIF